MTLNKRKRLLTILQSLKLGQLLTLARARHTKENLINILMKQAEDEIVLNELFTEATKIDFKNP